MLDIKKLESEVSRRRTFAIISHPDAGKTTLTEKLLLYGGAIHLAGAVKAKSGNRHTTSDWMDIEKQRGISVSTSVLRFEYDGIQVNLLDTPGHKDFSEDTFRTLVAVDAAVMLIDAAKGVEPQTRKLFEVCRMRGLPIFTFFNKLDRPSRSPLDLIDELEKVLGIRSSPVSWPIGMGSLFKGVYDRRKEEVLLFESTSRANASTQIKSIAINPNSEEFIKQISKTKDEWGDSKDLQKELIEQLELLEIAGDPYDQEQVSAGKLTPVFFGSAMNNFGVQHFLESFLKMAPSPTPRESTIGPVPPTTPRFSGVFFKIQANMDPQHRDRVAFLRVCSGKFTKGMAVQHTRLKKEIRLNKSLHFFAQERVLIEEAWPGDIVGLLDTTGDFRIGDTLCEGEAFDFDGVPRFSPEFFSAVIMTDPMKRKQLKTGLEQLSEEGVVQIFHAPGKKEVQPIVGVVGVLQFEVLEHRLKSEYGVSLRLDRLPYTRTRWLTDNGSVNFEEELNVFQSYSECLMLSDRDELPIVLFKTEWTMNWAIEKHKNLNFLSVAPRVTVSK